MADECGYKIHNSTGSNIKFWVTWGLDITVGQTLKIMNEVGMCTIFPDHWATVPTPGGGDCDLSVTDMDNKVLAILKNIHADYPTILFFNGEVIHK